MPSLSTQNQSTDILAQMRGIGSEIICDTVGKESFWRGKAKQLGSLSRVLCEQPFLKRPIIPNLKSVLSFTAAPNPTGVLDVRDLTLSRIV